MSFERKFNTLLVKSDNSLYELSYDNGIELYIYDKDSKLKYKKKFVAGNYNFSNAFFNVDNEDSIYGVIFTKDNILLYTYINEEYIYKSALLKIDNPRLKIIFPYIKKIDNKIHLFYYLVDTTRSGKCTLIHYFYNGQKWVKTEIDNIKYFILTNFVVTFNDDTPTIFYLNDYEGYEEVFITRFNEKTSSWDSIIQGTNTGKTKVYLSVIESPKNLYHMVFSENNGDRYHCTYYSGELVNNKFLKKDYIIIQDAVACEFSHILKVNNELYIQWLEFNELFTSFSEDNGSTWSDPKSFFNDTDDSIIRYDYKSNIRNNIPLDVSYIFSYKTSHCSLGIPNNLLPNEGVKNK